MVTTIEHTVNINGRGTAPYRTCPQPIQKLLHSLIHRRAYGKWAQGSSMADLVELSTTARNPAATRVTARMATRSAALADLRRLLPGVDDIHSPLPFGLPALDSHLPRGGLARGALHEIVPATEGAFPAVFGFVVALLANLRRAGPL